MLNMKSAMHFVTHGHRYNKDLQPLTLHPAVSDLFASVMNPDSLILPWAFHADAKCYCSGGSGPNVPHHGPQCALLGKVICAQCKRVDQEGMQPYLPGEVVRGDFHQSRPPLASPPKYFDTGDAVPPCQHVSQCPWPPLGQLEHLTSTLAGV